MTSSTKDLTSYIDMALVTISGFPCSGKSSTARRLRDDFETRLGEPSYKGPKLKVMLVDDESCHVPRSTYDGESDIVLHYRSTEERGCRSFNGTG